MEDDEKICRICYDTEKKEDKFISPCSCKGDSRYVHKSCFNKWLLVNQNSETYDKCPTCKASYIRKDIDIDKKMVESKTSATFFTICIGSLFFLTLFLLLTFISSAFTSIFLIILYFTSFCVFDFFCYNSSFFELYFYLAVFLLFLGFTLKGERRSNFTSFWAIGLYIFCFATSFEDIWDCLYKNFLRIEKMETGVDIYDFEKKEYVSGII